MIFNYYIPIKPTPEFTTVIDHLTAHELKTLTIYTEVLPPRGSMSSWFRCPHCLNEVHFHPFATEHWRKCVHCGLYVDEEDGGKFRLAEEKRHEDMLNKSAIDGLALGMELTMRSFGALAAKHNSIVGIAEDEIKKGQICSWDPATGRLRPAIFKEDCDYGNQETD